jgi:hypothetical protein
LFATDLSRSPKSYLDLSTPIARPTKNKFCKETFTNFQIHDFRSRLHETKKDCAKIHQYEVVGWARAKKSNLFAV